MLRWFQDLKYLGDAWGPTGPKWRKKLKHSAMFEALVQEIKALTTLSIVRKKISILGVEKTTNAKNHKYVAKRPFSRYIFTLLSIPQGSFSWPQ